MRDNNNSEKHNDVLFYFRRLLSLRSEKAPEEESVASIKAGVEFRGARLWILIFAIFVASLGLNTNSAPVIIGAMLISPLMGPIMGIGLSVGINDFELLKRAFRSFAVATVFSVLTAAVYFSVTPIAEAQSELLARTSPTIYDVLIAFFGGIAGIVALGCKDQRYGNVIPGVAIATAIMPPLCTTGFGIATGNWVYAAGAFYLYIINSIFISLATFVGVNIFRFKKKVFVDKQREKRVKNIIISIAVLTMLPATLLTYFLVKENYFTKRATDFITFVVMSDGVQVVSKDIDYENRSIRLVTLGDEISEENILRMKNCLADYDLADVTLSIVQGTKNLTAAELKSMIGETRSGVSEKSAQLLANEKARGDLLQKQLDFYTDFDCQGFALSGEMGTLFPNVSRVSVSYAVDYTVASDSLVQDTLTLVCVALRSSLSSAERDKMEEWLKVRLQQSNVRLLVSDKQER